MLQLSTAYSNAALVERKRLYRSPRWKHFRAAYLMQDPWCVMCRISGELVKAKVLDHKEGHGIDWQSRFWTGPFQGLCAHHHAVKYKTLSKVRTHKQSWISR